MSGTRHSQSRPARRRLGGVVLAFGAGLVLISLGAIAADLGPDGEITGASCSASAWSRPCGGPAGDR
jgi:3-oxoacyl-(acyl-carrier-protein) synthase